MGYLAKQTTVSLADLPEDVFVMILDGLEAWDMVRCQMVSRLWRKAFLNPVFLRLALRKYPKCREIALPSSKQDQVNWKALFDSVASHYYHMSRGKARQIVKIKLQSLEQYGHWYPIGQWDYHESQPGGRLYHENPAPHLSRLGNKPYLFRATLWSYDDGLVACAPDISACHSSRDKATVNPLAIMDISSDEFYTVPFDGVGKLIRNITLRNRTLVIEWAESKPYHDLNDNEKVHRHFATCYDVIPVEDGESPGWQILRRNEWKMHFLGIPLNSRDRFFSTHNGTHYAVYFWQPNRSMYTGDEDMPIEALFVWDITTPSTYLPSLDPTSSALPDEDKRPHMLARFSFRELDFLGIRQHSTITLLTISIDSESYSITVRENFCYVGRGYFDPAEQLWQANTTTFKFLGEGPARRKEWDGELPPYRGHCSMESADVEKQERWFIPIMEIADQISGVRFSLVETCFTGQVENNLLIRIKSLGEWATLDDAVVRELAAHGRIAGDERWIIGQNSQMQLVVAKF